MASAAQAPTATAPTAVSAVRSSPRRSPAHRMRRTGCTRCTGCTSCTGWTWLIEAIGPIPRPRYQAKKPRKMLIALLCVSGVLQTAALEVVTAPEWEPHLHRMRVQLRSLRDALVTLVSEPLQAGTLTVVPRGGLNLWLRLLPVVEACARERVLVLPG